MAGAAHVSRRDWWRSFYAGGSRPVGLEWYAPFGVVEPFVAEALRRTPRGGGGDGPGEAARAGPARPAVIDVGCGLSAAWEDLLRVGAGSVVGVDYSPEAVAAQRAETGGLPAAREGRLVFRHADATDMRGAAGDATADVVLDKGTMDCVCLSGHARALAYLDEARRVLRPGGRMVVCSVHAGRFAPLLAEGGRDAHWRVERREAVEYSPLELPEQRHTHMYVLERI